MPMRDPSILTRNLEALGRSNPEMAERVAAASPCTLTWEAAKPAGDSSDISGGTSGVTSGGLWSAARLLDGQPVTLASRYDPQREADRLVKELDDESVASAAVLGFGLGYHARAAAQRLGRQGVLIIFEPDAAQLRAVLEQVDHANWIASSNVFFFGDDTDRSTLTAKLEGYAAILTQGTRLITHPPSRRFHEQRFAQFGKDLAELMSFCRTNLATALVNAARTCRNLAMNLGTYTAGATTEELLGAAKGVPAVCVGAGPSLVRNVDLLRDPDIRKNIVLITVQTALRPLLDRGIRPDFVTALDYSPICARFYEELPDLPDVTLVAEPKAHPAVLAAYPGPVRLLKNDFCETAIGPQLARPRTAMKSGATVAHLSLYLAEHLGCDPIILIGQDLGFSDGLYYAPGTAVHKVWEPELSAINTIEMMEWTRIARMRGHIQRREDIYGRPCFSDEQMLTYLKQFERDFKQMADAGRTVIDATQGGLPKEHTQRETLADALKQFAVAAAPSLPTPPRQLDLARLESLLATLRGRVEQLQQLRKICRESTALLDDMQRHLETPGKFNRLFRKLDTAKARVHDELCTVFSLVNTVNIIGAFHRQRSDRLTERSGAKGHEKIGRQLARDRDNIRWLEQAGDETLSIFRAASESIQDVIKRENKAQTTNKPAGHAAPAVPGNALIHSA